MILVGTEINPGYSYNIISSIYPRFKNMNDEYGFDERNRRLDDLASILSKCANVLRPRCVNKVMYNNICSVNYVAYALSNPRDLALCLDNIYITCRRPEREYESNTLKHIIKCNTNKCIIDMNNDFLEGGGAC